jgi:AcrR family transcriptional regulator
MDALITASLELIERGGTTAFTMRDLATHLGVSHMAAYHYVKSKDELLRAVGDHVWASIEIPPPSVGPWYERLRAAVLAERAALRPYPGLDAAVVFLHVPSKRAFEDAELDLLLASGVGPAQAVPAFRTLMSWVAGHRFIESALRDPERRRPPDEKGKAQRMSEDTELLPGMRAEAYFVFGLDTFILGLRAEFGV